MLEAVKAAQVATTSGKQDATEQVGAACLAVQSGAGQLGQ